MLKEQTFHVEAKEGKILSTADFSPELLDAFRRLGAVNSGYDPKILANNPGMRDGIYAQADANVNAILQMGNVQALNVSIGKNGMITTLEITGRLLPGTTLPSTLVSVQTDRMNWLNTRNRTVVETYEVTGTPADTLVSAGQAPTSQTTHIFAPSQMSAGNLAGTMTEQQLQAFMNSIASGNPLGALAQLPESMRNNQEVQGAFQQLANAETLAQYRAALEQINGLAGATGGMWFDSENILDGSKTEVVPGSGLGRLIRPEDWDAQKIEQLMKDGKFDQIQINRDYLRNLLTDPKDADAAMVAFTSGRFEEFVGYFRPEFQDEFAAVYQQVPGSEITTKTKVTETFTTLADQRNDLPKGTNGLVLHTVYAGDHMLKTEVGIVDAKGQFMGPTSAEVEKSYLAMLGFKTKEDLVLGIGYSSAYGGKPVIGIGKEFSEPGAYYGNVDLMWDGKRIRPGASMQFNVSDSMTFGGKVDFAGNVQFGGGYTSPSGKYFIQMALPLEGGKLGTPGVTVGKPGGVGVSVSADGFSITNSSPGAIGIPVSAIAAGGPAAWALVGADILLSIPESIEYNKQRSKGLGAATGYFKQTMDPMMASLGMSPEQMQWSEYSFRTALLMQSPKSWALVGTSRGGAPNAYLLNPDQRMSSKDNRGKMVPQVEAHLQNIPQAVPGQMLDARTTQDALLQTAGDMLALQRYERRLGSGGNTPGGFYGVKPLTREMLKEERANDRFYDRDGVDMPPPVNPRVLAYVQETRGRVEGALGELLPAAVNHTAPPVTELAHSIGEMFPPRNETALLDTLLSKSGNVALTVDELRVAMIGTPDLVMTLASEGRLQVRGVSVDPGIFTAE